MTENCRNRKKVINSKVQLGYKVLNVNVCAVNKSKGDADGVIYALSPHRSAPDKIKETINSVTVNALPFCVISRQNVPDWWYKSLLFYFCHTPTINRLSEKRFKLFLSYKYFLKEINCVTLSCHLQFYIIWLILFYCLLAHCTSSCFPLQYSYTPLCRVSLYFPQTSRPKM